MKKQIIIGSAIICSLFYSTSSFSQGHICEDKKEVKPKNMAIRKSVYKSVHDINDSKLSDEKKKEWQNKYGKVQKEFNDIYTEMKKDKLNFASWKKLCERYGDDLERTEVDANNFNTDVKKELKIKEAGFGIGVDDVIALAKFAVEAHKNNAEKLYKDLKWDDWNDIIKIK